MASSGIVEILYGAMQFDIPEILQGAYALLGDYCKICYVHVHPRAADFVPLVARSLVTEGLPIPVCNNAAWAVGELAIKAGAIMEPFAPGLLVQLITILEKAKEPNLRKAVKTLLENSSITIGRFGLACPAAMAAGWRLHVDVVLAHADDSRQ